MRDKDPAMVVGLATRMMAFKTIVPRNYIQLTIKVGIGIYILSRPCRGPIELPGINDIVISAASFVEIEPRRDRAMSHHSRPRDLVLLRVGHNRRHSAGVIDMPMRINHRVHP